MVRSLSGSHALGLVLMVGLVMACGDEASSDSGAGAAGSGSGGAGATGSGGGPSAGGAGGCDADLQADPDNCGECGRACEGACEGGRCAPHVIASGLDLYVDGITTMGRIHLDATHVYFGMGQDVVRCPKEGCSGAPEIVIPGLNGSQPQDHLLVPGGAYAVTSYDLLYCATGCATPTTIPLQDDGVMLVARGDTLLVIEQGRIESCPIDGCTDLELAGFTGDVQDVELDGDVLWEVGYAGVSTSTQYDDTGGHRLALTDDWVYWTTNHTGRPVVRCEKGRDCVEPQTLWDGEDASDVAAEGGQAYWTLPGMTGPDPGGTLYRCDTDACASPVTLGDALHTPAAIALDDGFVYLMLRGELGASTPNGAIVRVPR